ncbi:hypothetical protein ENUP19_0050G0058 [Entamoeba nuttalli]|uniref:Uncharacterized protein n=2 Tax=Entamoeba nuttalli TaxID=412467 RepID=K2HZN0_ENTNP|nr:hypothetical protein ENU1_040730 [Entamoeba nuttalli P19]EKE41905.1 hypothetical protein ENU1_040730 [Entamoeba nuttalli P19]|eukprot:XP_008855769.1 hypothetical protein ENU1_040730 [Entamoeba nuttalli P19]
MRTVLLILIGVLLQFVTTSYSPILLSGDKMQTVILSPPFQQLVESPCHEGKHKGVIHVFKNTSARRVKLRLDFYNNPPNKLEVYLYTQNKCIIKTISKSHLAELRHVVQPHQTISVTIISRNEEKGLDNDSRTVMRVRSNQVIVKMPQNRGITCPDSTPLLGERYYQGNGQKWYRLKVNKGEERIITTCSSYTRVPVKIELFDNCGGKPIKYETMKCNNENGRVIRFKGKYDGNVFVHVTALPGMRKNKQINSQVIRRGNGGKYIRRFYQMLDRYSIESFSDKNQMYNNECNKARVSNNMFLSDKINFIRTKKTLNKSSKRYKRSVWYKVFVPRRGTISVNTCSWQSTGSAHIEVLKDCKGESISVERAKCQNGRNERITIRGKNQSRWVYLRVEENDENDGGNVMVQINRIGANRQFRRRFFILRPFFRRRRFTRSPIFWKRRNQKRQIKKNKNNKKIKNEDIKKELDKKKKQLVKDFEKSIQKKNQEIRNVTTSEKKELIKSSEHLNKTQTKQHPIKEIPKENIEIHSSNHSIIMILLGVVLVVLLGISIIIIVKLMKKKSNYQDIPL